MTGRARQKQRADDRDEQSARRVFRSFGSHCALIRLTASGNRGRGGDGGQRQLKRLWRWRLRVCVRPCVREQKRRPPPTAPPTITAAGADTPTSTPYGGGVPCRFFGADKLISYRKQCGVRAPQRRRRDHTDHGRFDWQPQWLRRRCPLSTAATAVCVVSCRARLLFTSSSSTVPHASGSRL